MQSHAKHLVLLYDAMLPPQQVHGLLHALCEAPAE